MINDARKRGIVMGSQRYGRGTVGSRLCGTLGQPVAAVFASRWLTQADSSQMERRPLWYHGTLHQIAPHDNYQATQEHRYGCVEKAKLDREAWCGQEAVR